MSPKLGFPLLENPEELARYQGWSKAVYEDLLAVQRGQMSEAAFDEKYLATKAILVLDVTGFTVTAIHGGAISSFLRILGTHKICFPVLREHGAILIHAFADDVIALFDDCNVALDASLEIHRRISIHNQSRKKSENPPECCIGIGYGEIYEIGPNHAMGDEMNRASVLGEDTARGGETLVTENVRDALTKARRAMLESQSVDDLLFPYCRVRPDHSND
jgi:adenylate cyclase